MANTRAQLSELFTPIYDEFMLMGFAEEKQIAPKVFQVIDDKTKEYKTDGISGTGEWEQANELAAGGYEDLVLGYPNTIEPLKYWKKIQCSFEASDQDEYAMLKSKVTTAKQIGIGGRAKVERLCASVLYNGFSVACPDGQFFFDTDHPKNRVETGIVYDNLLTGPLSHDNLELAETQITNNFYDMKGIPILPAENPTLLYPPALRGTALRILSDRAEYRPGQAVAHSEMEMNRFAGRYNPVEWRFLSAAEGGSDSAWYILYNEMNFLKLVYNRRPSFDNWIDKDIEAYIFKGSMMCTPDVCDWRAGFASTGL